MKMWKLFTPALESSSSQSRSASVTRNLVALFAVRGTSFVVNLLVIRVGLELVDPNSYGIWLVLSSFLTWISLFDFGLGNVIRNGVAEALARNDIQSVRKHVSTGYGLVAATSLFLFLFAAVSIPFIDWAQVLNAREIPSETLNLLVLVAAACFCLRLVSNLVTFLLLGSGASALSAVVDLATNIIALIGLLTLKIAEMGSLLSLGAVMSVVMAVIPIVSTILVFHSELYRPFRPSFRHFDKTIVRRLLASGSRFFVISIATIVVFTSSNLVIAHVCGPADVTVYNIALKYFSLLTIGFSVALTPFWSAFTSAFSIGDEAWVRTTMRRLVAVWGTTVLIALVMILLSPIAIRLWLGNAVRLSSSLCMLFALYACVTNWNSLFAYFLNGVGKVQMQMRYAVFLSIVHIPFCLFLSVGLGMGLAGIVLASIGSLLVGAVFQPIQYRRIISGTAVGVWAR